MSSRVVVRDLKKRYGQVDAVRGVSFEVGDGEIYGLLGPNGAGKTTTVECVIGLATPDAGDIQVCGLDARRDPRGVKQKIGAALQTTALQDKITPREALTLFGALYQRSASPASLIERFGLTGKADAHFDTLSIGQQHRLALALAFVNDPEVVFLDEPTNGLDPQARRDIHDEILRMKRDGHTVLLTTHHLDEAQALCDRVAIIDNGRIVATGTPQELISRSSTTPSISLIASMPVERAWFAGVAGLDDLHVDGASVRFRAARVNRSLVDVMTMLEERGVDVAELHVQKSTLEDVFLALTSAAGASDR